MFDIRKIQEHVIYEAVKNESNEGTAKEIVYGKDESSKSLSDVVWVNSTMKKLENKFDEITTKKIRMKCQCTTGYSKVLFEMVFKCKVDVELVKSIKCGDDKCLMRIILQNSPW